MNDPNLLFDATQYDPKQSAAPHPVGNGFLGRISNVEVKQNKEGTGGFMAVELSSQEGRIITRYNLWSQSEKAVEIARGQLSALCYATGVLRLSKQGNGKELIGAQLRYDVGLQNADDPNGYVEVKHIYDVNGNEPSKGGGGQSGQQQAWGGNQQAASQQTTQPQNGFNGASQSNPQPQNGGSWGGSQQSQQNTSAPQDNAQPTWGGAQTGGAASGDAPPWMR